MIEVNLKEKLKEVKQKSIEKRKDLDLKLYLDFQRELLEYRCTMIPFYPIEQINKIRNKHNAILERLAKRLNICTIRNSLNRIENLKNE